MDKMIKVGRRQRPSGSPRRRPPAPALSPALREEVGSPGKGSAGPRPPPLLLRLRPCSSLPFRRSPAAFGFVTCSASVWSARDRAGETGGAGRRLPGYPALGDRCWEAEAAGSRTGATRGGGELGSLPQSSPWLRRQRCCLDPSPEFVFGCCHENKSGVWDVCVSSGSGGAEQIQDFFFYGENQCVSLAFPGESFCDLAERIS